MRVKLRPFVAQGRKGATVNATGCGFDPLEEIDAQSVLALVMRQSTLSLEFRHSTRNPSRIRRKVEGERALMETKCPNIRFSLSTRLCAGYKVKIKNKIKTILYF